MKPGPNRKYADLPEYFTAVDNIQDRMAKGVAKMSLRLKNQGEETIAMLPNGRDTTVAGL